MTNLEYIIENEKELLIETISRSKSIVKRKDGKFALCEDCPCEKCIASDAKNCGPILEKMFEEEYKEPCPFYEKDELVEVSEDGVNWQLRKH